MSIMPLQTIMGIDVVTAFFAVVPLFFVLIPDPVTREEAVGVNPVTAVARDVREGFRFIWQWSGLLLGLVAAALINGTINPAFALLPILVSKTFGKGVLELGWMEMAWGIGMIGGGLILSVWGGFKRKILTTLVALIIAGIFFLTLGLVPASAFDLALGLIFMSGLMNPLMNGPFMAIVQSVVPLEMQGRVFTVIMSMSGLAAPIGMAISGPLADRFGVQLWFVIGGIVSILMGVALGLVPATFHLEESVPEQAPAVSTEF